MSQGSPGSDTVGIRLQALFIVGDCLIIIFDGLIIHGQVQIAFKAYLVAALPAAQAFVHLVKIAQSLFCLSQTDIDPGLAHQAGRAVWLVVQLDLLSGPFGTGIMR